MKFETEPERFGFLALHSILQESQDGMLLFDDEGTCRFMGKRVGDLFGIETAVYVGRKYGNIFSYLATSCDGEGVLHLLQTKLQLPKPMDVDILRPEPRRIEVRVHPMSHAGTPLGTLVIFRDVSKLRALERTRSQLKQRLDEVAPIDELTGLPNWRKFHEELEREYGRARRSASGFAVLRADVDGLRKVNESFGIPRGDEVLEEVADALESCRRGYDLIVRHEGDEFAALAPQSDSAGALVFAQRILDTVRAREFRIPGHHVTLSIGGAVWHSSREESWSDTVKRAGDALRKAKEAGGNTIVIG